MYGDYQIDDLDAPTLKALLSADIDQLSDDEMLAIKDFVHRVGGIRNARLAVHMLSQLEAAS